MAGEWILLRNRSKDSLKHMTNYWIGILSSLCLLWYNTIEQPMTLLSEQPLSFFILAYLKRAAVSTLVKV